MNVEQARFNMIKQQIRTWGVVDESILELLRIIPREDFVPPTYRHLAFADITIPLGHDQVMMTPKEEAKLLQSVRLQPIDKILEVGTGCGYVTALLAKQSKWVY